jgi:hypothetical protein
MSKAEIIMFLAMVFLDFHPEVFLVAIIKLFFGEAAYPPSCTTS